MGLPRTATVIAKPIVDPQSNLQFEQLEVQSFEDIKIKIGGKPIEIKDNQGAVLRIFPRNGNLLFILEGRNKKATLEIYPKSEPGSAQTADFNKRGQVVISGNFNGAHVISITQKSK